MIFNYYWWYLRLNQNILSKIKCFRLKFCSYFLFLYLDIDSCNSSLEFGEQTSVSYIHHFNDIHSAVFSLCNYFSEPNLNFCLLLFDISGSNSNSFVMRTKFLPQHFHAGYLHACSYACLGLCFPWILYGTASLMH